MVSATEREAHLAQYDRWSSLTAMFFEQAAKMGDRPFLWAKRDGTYRAWHWPEVARQARALAHGLRAIGIKPGDRVALVAENRPEWLIADVGIMAAGAVTVPAYTTNMPDDHLHVLDDSGARVVIVSTSALLKRVLPAAARASRLGTVIAIEAPQVGQSSGYELMSWDSLIARGEAEGGDTLPEAVTTAQRTDTACLIYTSGTGGAPKGVMLSHGAIICNSMGAYDLLSEFSLADEVFLSFLPLSHSYEHTAGQFFPISIGAEIYYVEGIEALGRNMAEARPTIMTAVPRLYETMHQRIMQGMRRAPPLRRKLFMKAVELGRRRYDDPRSLGLGDRLLDWLLDRLVRSKVKDRFGGRIKALVSGGAPLNVDIGLFFTALGLRLLQGYGQTETAPVVSCNRPGRVRIHTVGPPLRGVEVKIADDGEILVHGELVMQGYWNNPDATADVLKDGWIHTGDIGNIDENGFIQITDRKKDIIVNSGGDNVAPQRIEGFLTLQPEIHQAMVHGDKRPYLVALIVPDAEAATEWAKANGMSPDLRNIVDEPEFVKHIRAAVDRVNAGLPVIETVRRFRLSAEPFTVENGMMTPSMKIRRHVIRATWRDELESLY